MTEAGPAEPRRDRGSSRGATRPGTILQGDREKAYRPLPEAERRAAFDAALGAYDRGDFFEAHELLEPAWMGAADPGERDLHQGLIKLAAAFVHGVRGNPLGIAKNLEGARSRLADAAPTAAGAASGLDLGALLADIEDRLDRLAATPTDHEIEPPVIRRIPR